MGSDVLVFVLDPSQSIIEHAPMSLDDNQQTTARTDISVPTYTNKEPILFSGNDAEIASTMHEIKQYLIRTNKHQPQPLLSDRAVLVSGGKTAVESVHAIPFLLGTLADGDAYMRRCAAERCDIGSP